MRKALAVIGVLVGVAGMVVCLGGLAQGQQVHRNGFEHREPSWSKGPADAPFRVSAHTLTDQTAHSGQFSEYLQFTAEQGHHIHYVYPLGRGPVNEELVASVWIKANRPGIQLLGRLVLPREPNPNQLDERLTTLIRGDQYDRVGRWQRLELRKPVALAKEQQQLMRVELKRDVDFRDAYLDQMILNLYGGPGKTEVWIDDLEAGPLLEATPFRPISRPGEGSVPGSLIGPARPPSRIAAVEFREGLLVSGKRFMFRGIRHSDTPLKALRDAGFNTVWFDYATPNQLLEEAVDLGFWVVPALPVTSNDPKLVSLDGINREIGRFLLGDAVLFWELGGGMAREQADQVVRAAQVVRASDPQRPLAVDAWDGFGPYSRTVDLVGTHRWPLMTTLELTQYRQWLEQRRLLCRPGTFLWTWVQTHLPDWYTALVYDRPWTARFEEPIGPQPEQIRLLTYLSLAAGCRGLGFWSDRFLADSHQGRDRLLALALLNQEMQMLEPLLGGADLPRWIDTSVPEIQAAVIRTNRGVLVLPMWLGKGAQFVPGQLATSKLTVVVPEVPVGTQAWLVGPAEVRSLKTERVVGGTRVTIPEFGVTSAVVFTADNHATGLLVRFQDQMRKMRPLAAQWARNLAEVELEKVSKIETQLEQGGHTLPDGTALMADARRRLQTCDDFWKANDYARAYAEAERVLRPLRILMRAQWEQAVRGLDSPVASPYAVSFFTLPRHWRFLEEVRQTSAAANQLPDGNFEKPQAALPKSESRQENKQLPAALPESWLRQENILDEVVTDMRIGPGMVKEGKQSLKLEIKPKTPQTPPPALDRTFLALNSPAIRLQPGTLVRISAWVSIPTPISASTDGALFYDSAGGEPLGVRLTGPTAWKRFTLYRRVPASGSVSVTLALTGLGTVYFDDVQIVPLIPSVAAGR